MVGAGYLVWLMHTENHRRDRLRARGDLPPTSPAYEVVEHWLRQPGADAEGEVAGQGRPTLGLYGSLDAAAPDRRQRRQHAISVVLHNKIAPRSTGPWPTSPSPSTTSTKIAARLAASADYDTLTDLINADLARRG